MECYFGLVWLSVFTLVAVAQREESDVLLNIVTACPRSPQNPKHVGQILVVSDFAAIVNVNCANGNITKKGYDEVSVNILISVDQKESQKSTGVCTMNKVPNHQTYQVEVDVSRRYNPILYHPSHRFAVFCTYDPFATARTRSFNVNFPSSSPTRIIKDKGKNMHHVVLMEVAGLDNHLITGALNLGAKIELRGHVLEKPKSAELLIDRCTAFNNLTSYEILKDGCGDGRIFPVDTHFTLSGNWFYSPIFTVFHLRGTTDIRFECIVYFCRPPCKRKQCRQPKESLSGDKNKTEGHKTFKFNPETKTSNSSSIQN